MGILDRYLEQVEKDKLNEDNSLPTDMDFVMTDKEKEYYQKELDRQRNDPMDIKNNYMKAMEKVTKYTEEDLVNKGLLRDEEITSMKVLHAYCDECGEELISQGPPMFNPFTMLRICAHHCKCGKKYNLDYAYPRVAYYNKDNKEVLAYGI